MNTRHKTKDGGPAFPIPRFHTWQDEVPGMSLRDWFAGQALVANVGPLQSLGEIAKMDSRRYMVARVEAAYAYADAMLAARTQEPK